MPGQLNDVTFEFKKLKIIAQIWSNGKIENFLHFIISLSIFKGQRNLSLMIL